VVRSRGAAIRGRERGVSVAQVLVALLVLAVVALVVVVALRRVL
jgi:hypothetical protein